MTSGCLGVLRLDTRFPRPPGDVGNPQTWSRASIPVRYATVVGATPQRVVVQADALLLEPFLQAARALADEGARLIATTCGFLGAYQAALASAVSVPVLTSSLLQCARLRHPGIVTIDASALSDAVLSGAGVPRGTPVAGVAPGCEFQRRILGNDTELDLAQAQRDVVEAAVRLVREHPQVSDVVLECTNMAPYRDAVACATGRSVVDLESVLLAAWRQLP